MYIYIYIHVYICMSLFQQLPWLWNNHYYLNKQLSSDWIFIVFRWSALCCYRDWSSWTRCWNHRWGGLRDVIHSLVSIRLLGAQLQRIPQTMKSLFNEQCSRSGTQSATQVFWVTRYAHSKSMTYDHNTCKYQQQVICLYHDLKFTCCHINIKQASHMIASSM